MSRSLRALLASAAPLLLATPGVLAFEEQPAAAATSEMSVEAVLDEYQEAYSAWVQKIQSASESEQAAIMEERPATGSYAKRLWPIIEEKQGSEEALKALGWILSNVDRRQSRAQVLGTLQESYMDHDGMAAICAQMMYVNDRRVMGILESLADESPHRDVRGNAAFSYASWVKSNKRGDNTETVENYFEMITEDYADIPHRRRGTLGKAAEIELYELRNLQVGQPAPDIVGEDMDGTPFKLSDYRGKVVFLDYWAHW